MHGNAGLIKGFHNLIVFRRASLHRKHLIYVKIALIYPSADVSDFWARNYLALTKRLDQLGIEYETTEFASRQIEHSLQSTYASQVAQDKDESIFFFELRQRIIQQLWAKSRPAYAHEEEVLVRNGRCV